MMHKKKSLWIIPIIVALIVAVTGIFAAPSAMPGGEQNQVALAQQEKPSPPPLGPSSKDLPAGTCYAIVNGKLIPVKEGTGLGKVEDIKGPIILGGHGDDYYNHIEVAEKCIDGKIVIIKALATHLDRATQQRRAKERLKEFKACGGIVEDDAKCGHLISAKQEASGHTEYEGYAYTALYRDSALQTFVQSTLDYWDNGEEVGGTDYHCPYGHRPQYTLGDYDCSWYPGPNDRIWSFHRCEFSDGFDHASAARYVAWVDDWDPRGYIYPKPESPYWGLVIGDRWVTG